MVMNLTRSSSDYREAATDDIAAQLTVQIRAMRPSDEQPLQRAAGLVTTRPASQSAPANRKRFGRGRVRVVLP